jgi:hypothetical protein
VSFNNDDEGDGLAALFGGITPQAAPPGAPGTRRAAQQAAAAPADPNAAPVAPPSPASPAWPSPPPAQEVPAAPPSWAAPGVEPPRTPQYPGLAPNVPIAPQTPSALPSAPLPPAFGAPPPNPAPSPNPAPPAYDLPAYDLPAPAAAPSYSSPEPPQAPPYGAPSFPAPVTPQYPGLAATPVDPPTAQYPRTDGPPAWGAPPPASGVPTPAQAPPPVQAPPPAAWSGYSDPSVQAAPPPLNEPPAPTGFEALGLAQPSPPPTAEPPSAGYGAATESAYASAYARPGSPSFDDRATGQDDRIPAPESVPALRSDAAPPATAFPPGPLLPTANPMEPPEHLERATTGERVGLVLAVLTGPVGLILAIVSAVRGARRRGWVIGVGRAAIVLGVISTIGFGIGGVVLADLRAQQMQFDRLAAASAEFCAAGTENPALVAPPTLGWPAPAATVAESLTLMQEWTTRWTDLAATSPEELRAGLELLVAQGTTIVDTVTQARSVDDAANQAAIAATATQSGVADWFQTYCVSP